MQPINKKKKKKRGLYAWLIGRIKHTQDTWICLETKASCYSSGLGILSGLKVKFLKDYRCIDPLS